MKPTGMLIVSVLGLIALAQTVLSLALPLRVAYAACTPPPEGMLAWWQAESNTTESLSGSSGAAFGNAGFAGGMVGQSFRLDGDSDYFTANGDFDLPEQFTIDAWIYPVTLPDVGLSVIVHRIDQSASHSADFSYGFAIVPGDRLRGVVGGVSGITDYATPGPTLIANAWQHIAMTYDGTAGPGEKMGFYVNGMSAGGLLFGIPHVDSGGIPIDLEADDPTFFGSSAVVPDVGEFEGLIDEVEFFGRYSARQK